MEEFNAAVSKLAMLTEEASTEPTTEVKMRWWSWNKLVNEGKKHSYQGTVPANVKAKRRAKNKRAKASRKINR